MRTGILAWLGRLHVLITLRDPGWVACMLHPCIRSFVLACVRAVNRSTGQRVNQGFVFHRFDHLDWQDEIELDFLGKS